MRVTKAAIINIFLVITIIVNSGLHLSLTKAVIVYILQCNDYI
jgi:hypothetical protein